MDKPPFSVGCVGYLRLILQLLMLNNTIIDKVSEYTLIKIVVTDAENTLKHVKSVLDGGSVPSGMNLIARQRP